MIDKFEIARNIKDDIDAASVDIYDEELRWHLGGSLIGHECKRYLWYSYRWCFKEEFNGRMLRLFNRGHREEELILTYLRKVGFTVYEFDTNAPMKEDGTYPQFRISDCGGHFGGSLDGIAYFPERYNIPEPILLEFKTSTTGGPFNKLTEQGMRLAKPVHFAQVCTYGTDEKYNFKYALYIVVNKNDDDLHVELVELDKDTGDRMRHKANGIITSQTPPPRLSDNATFYKCTNCKAKDICHTSALPLMNCRSCRNASPIADGEFHCSVFNGTIPREHVRNPQNCESYEAITRNV